MNRRRMAAVAVLPLLMAGCDWAQVGFNAANTGSDPSAVAITSANVAGLHQAWRVDDPSASSTNLVASGDTVYSSAHHVLAMGSPLNYFGGGCDPTIRTWAPTTTAAPGAPDTVGCPAPSPQVLASAAATPTSGPGGALEALDSTTGAIRWAIGDQTVTNPSPNVSCDTDTEGVGPAIVDHAIGLLVSHEACVFNGEDTVPSASTYTVDASTGIATEAAPRYDGFVSAVAAADDGSLYAVRTWSPTDDSVPSGLVDRTSIVGPTGVVFTAPGLAGLGPLTIDATSIYSVDDTGTLWAIDRASGEVRWSAPTGTAPGGNGAHPVPSVAYGRVYLSNGSKLMAFDQGGVNGCATSGGDTTCAPVWSSTLPDVSSVEAPALRAGFALVRSGTTLSAFSASSGSPRWSAALGASSGDVSTLGSPSVAGKVVFVGAQDGHLLAYDVTGRSGCSGTPTVCTPLWSGALNGAPGASRPISAGGAVYVASAHDSSGTGVDITKFTL